MSITNKQLEKRRNYLGSSDVAAILGVDPFRSPVDVFYEKTGKVEEKPATAVMSRGTFLEPGIILFAESFLGGKIQKRELEITDDNGLFISHPDGIFKPNKRPVEAKSQNFGAKEQWGEEGTGEVPIRVAAQGLIHLWCWKQDICYVPADLPYRGLQMFLVERDEGVIKTIIEKCLEFREKYIKTDTPPPNSLPSEETVRFMRRKPKSTISIPGELVSVREAAKAKKLEAEKDFEVADLTLKGALKNAERGNFDGGFVTYFQYHKQAEKKIREACDYRSIRVNWEK